MKKTKRLWTEDILKLILRLSLPSMIWMFINSLYNIIDSIYIWHYSSEWLVALSLAFPIQIFLIAIAWGLGIASASLISRLAWEWKKEKIQQTMDFVTFLWWIYSILTLIIWIFFTQDIVWFFTQDPTVVSMTSWYLTIIMIWTVFMIIPMIFTNFLRGYGDALTPMKVMIIWAVLNIILDPLLIFWLWFFPKLWIEWAALATVASRWISSIYVIYFIYKQGYKIIFDYHLPEKRIIKDLINVGIPVSVIMILASVMILWANKIVWNYSIIALAVVWIYLRLEMFIFMPIMWLSQWIQPIIGYNYGNKQYERLKQTITYSMIITFIISIFAFSMFQLFPQFLISIFTKDTNIINIWGNTLKITSIAFPFMWLNMITSRIFQSFWKWLPSLIISLLRQVIITLPLMYILWKFYWLNGIWSSIPIAESSIFIVSIIWLYIFLRKKMIL